MKKSCKMKTLIVIMAIIILVSSIPIVAIEDQSVRLYVSERADGKCFLQGENETIKSKSQFDTYIENILIARLGEQYVLTFKKDTEAFEIVVDIVAAKMNNVENDHYLFAPVDFIDETYKILNIKFTTNANEYDLIPANTDL